MLSRSGDSAGQLQLRTSTSASGHLNFKPSPIKVNPTSKMDPDASIPDSEPSPFNYILSFLLVGVAWGFTTPFIRRAAADFNARQEKQQQQSSTDPATEPRGRSQTQSSSPDFRDEPAEEQELLVRDEAGADVEGDGVRRRSASQQRQEQQAGAGQEGEVDNTPAPAWMQSQQKKSWLRTKIVSVFWTVVNMLRTPAYSIPLVINLTGSIWFFLLVGKHGMSRPWSLVSRGPCLVF